MSPSTSKAGKSPYDLYFEHKTKPKIKKKSNKKTNKKNQQENTDLCVTNIELIITF
jgi:hypothetical protein